MMVQGEGGGGLVYGEQFLYMTDLLVESFEELLSYKNLVININTIKAKIFATHFYLKQWNRQMPQIC